MCAAPPTPSPLQQAPLFPAAGCPDCSWIYALPTGGPFPQGPVCSGVAQSYFTSQAVGTERGSSGQTGPDETWAQLNIGCIESSRDGYATFNRTQLTCVACSYTFTRIDPGVLLCRRTYYRSWKQLNLVWARLKGMQVSLCLLYGWIRYFFLPKNCL